MDRPLFTIGMATHNDYYGVYSTVQALRVYHDLRDVELVVVDNNPESPHGKATAELIENWVKGDVAGAKYVRFTAATGTAAPRNEIFSQASGRYVVCMDPHVFLVRGALDALTAYYRSNPDTADLISGPMVYDDLKNISTHFDDVWRGEMWGIWATDPRGEPDVWRCPCGRTLFRVQPAVPATPPGGEGNVVVLPSPAAFMPAATPGCRCTPPPALYGEHAEALRAAGFVETDQTPFEIPGQGLGVFSCRKDAWLGFNPNFRGFGGEEMYIHTKFRQAGRKCICIPKFRWVHRFGRPDGIPYPLSRWHKARNYVIGLRELGLSLAPAYEHFVGGGLLSRDDWEYLAEDPVTRVEPRPGMSTTFVASADCPSGCGGSKPQPASGQSLDELFAFVKATPRDLDQHADTIRKYASEAESIAAFVKRREWNVLLAAGKPKRLVVHQTEPDPLLDAVHASVQEANKAGAGIEYVTHVGGSGADSLVAEIQPVDLLVIDTVHHADRLWAELSKHGKKVNKRIMLRGTGAFGEQAEGGQGPGLLPAVRRFIHDNREWTVIYHTQDQYGLTVMSRDDADKKPLPSMWEQAVNAAKASWRAGKLVTDYGPIRDTPEHDQRLGVCLMCPSHNNGKCGECGCPVDRKTSFHTESCPLGKWLPIELPKVS